MTLRSEGTVARIVRRGRHGHVIRTTGVGAEPYGIVASPSGDRLYVAASLSGQVVALDPKQLDVLDRWDVPDEPRWLATSPSGRFVYVGSAYRGTISAIDTETGDVEPIAAPDIYPVGGEDPFSVRITGDPSVSPDGRTLVVPALYVDPNLSDSFGTEYYATSAAAVGRFDGAVVVVPLDPDGGPEGDARVTLAVGRSPDGRRIGGYASATAWLDDGKLAVAEEAVNGIVLVDPSSAVGSPATFDPVNNTALAAPNGPTALAVTGGVLIVRGWLGGEVWRLSASDPGIADPWAAGAQLAAVVDEPADEGTRMFYMAGDGVLGASGSAVSCSTCHFERRNDGLTWQPEGGPRQTPSLAGDIAETGPYTWDGDVDSIEDEVHATSVDRMGGTGPDDVQAWEIADYVRSTRRPILPEQPSDAVRRGEDVFEREGCGTCHGGRTLADAAKHRVLDVAVNTPTLVGVAATAPYFHDGSAPTLEDAVEAAREGRMGEPADLTDDEAADLVTYLRSL